MISLGGYLCKKFRTAAYPTRVMYNLGYCWPSLTSAGACPFGWSKYPSLSFCYYSYTAGYFSHDETFRQCQQLGADLVYIESSGEFTWLKSTAGYIQGTYDNNKLNGHGWRYGGNAGYGHTLYWSNGVVVDGRYGFNWVSPQPDDACSQEMYLEYWYSSNSLNDIRGYYNYYDVIIYDNGVGPCKRPLCGMIHSTSKKWIINFMLTS